MTSNNRRRSRVNSITISSNSNEQLFNLDSYNLNKEDDRKKTFIENGWLNEFLNYEDLALIGFYYLQKPDIVRCHFCDVTLGNFEAGDNALREHQRFSPNCPLIKRRNTNNIPINQKKLDEVLPEMQTFDVYGSRKLRRKSKVDDQNEILHPEYKLLQDRIRSFKMWPLLKQRPKELAEAGFFYSGQSDLVICFSCGLFLCQWRPDDNVWVEHSEHATKECSYLCLNHETVKLNKLKHAEEIKNFESTNECEAACSNSEVAVKKTEIDLCEKEDNSKFESLCKICLEKKSNVIFLPCRHVAVCGSCVFGLNDICPICRSDIKEKIDLFYA